MKTVVAFFCFMVVATLSFAQQDDSLLQERTEVIITPEQDSLEVPPPFEEEEDEELGEPLYLSPDSMEKIRKQADYSYMKNLDSMLRSLGDLPPEPEEEAPASGSIFDIAFVKIVIWGIAIFAVLYILYQLIAGKQNLFYKNKRLEFSEQGEDEKHRTVSPLILSQQAAARGDYRMAVRYQYLYILQLMQEKKFLVLQPQKTDAHYQIEVAGKPFAGDFATLTLQYEFVWYGEFALTGRQYETIAGGYRKFIETWL